MKVLYIAGFSRCGSTLLGSMLGQLDGFFNLGEARMIWQRSLVDDRHCGCGKSFSECETWQDIMGEFSSAHAGVSPQQMAEAVRDIARTRMLPLRSRLGTARTRTMRRAGELQDAVGQLYAAVRSVTEAEVLVDTSKVPMYGWMLRDSGLDVRVAHLIRDPRAVAQSRLVPKEHIDRQATMGGVSILNTAVTWNLVNRSIERLLADSAYRRLGYRQLIEDPTSVVKELALFVGAEPNTNAWLEGSTAMLKATHSVFGNPGRFTLGEVRLDMDDRWRELPRWKIEVIELFTSRLRHRYEDVL